MAIPKLITRAGRRYTPDFDATAKKGATLAIVETKTGWAKDTKGLWWKLSYLKKA